MREGEGVMKRIGGEGWKMRGGTVGIGAVVRSEKTELQEKKDDDRDLVSCSSKEAGTRRSKKK
jgi:hypothetical protein